MRRSRTRATALRSLRTRTADRPRRASRRADDPGLALARAFAAASCARRRPATRRRARTPGRRSGSRRRRSRPPSPSRRRPRTARSPIASVGTPNTPRAIASSVLRRSSSLTSGRRDARRRRRARRASSGELRPLDRQIGQPAVAPDEAEDPVHRVRRAVAGDREAQQRQRIERMLGRKLAAGCRAASPARRRSGT